MITKVKSNGRELKVGDVVTDNFYMMKEYQEIDSFIYIERDKRIEAVFKKKPHYLPVDALITRDEMKNNIIEMLSKRVGFLHQERLKGAEAIGKLSRIPYWIKWIFGAV